MGHLYKNWVQIVVDDLLGAEAFDAGRDSVEFGPLGEISDAVHLAGDHLVHLRTLVYAQKHDLVKYVRLLLQHCLLPVSPQYVLLVYKLRFLSPKKLPSIPL